MIFGIGTDIVSVGRMERDLERFGERFARRVLTEGEFAGFAVAAHPANYLAKRFAAKEAAVKALGYGFSDGLTLHQVEVAHDPRGRPLLRFSGRAATLLEELGVGESFLSISDERENAIAFVTLLKRLP